MDRLLARPLEFDRRGVPYLLPLMDHEVPLVRSPVPQQGGKGDRGTPSSGILHDPGLRGEEAGSYRSLLVLPCPDVDLAVALGNRSRGSCDRRRIG